MPHSKQAHAIVTVLGRLDHPTADEVFQEVRRELPRISLATVYRNLDALVAAGEARVRSIGAQKRYDPRADAHAHLHCTRCDRLVDVPLEGRLLDSLQQLARDGGMRYDGALVEVRGLCPGCQAV